MWPPSMGRKGTQTVAGVRCDCNGLCRACKFEAVTEKVWHDDGMNMESQQKRSFGRPRSTQEGAELHAITSQEGLAMVIPTIHSEQKHGKQVKRSVL